MGKNAVGCYLHFGPSKKAVLQKGIPEFSVLGAGHLLITTLTFISFFAS